MIRATPIPLPPIISASVSGLFCTILPFVHQSHTRNRSVHNDLTIVIDTHPAHILVFRKYERRLLRNSALPSFLVAYTPSVIAVCRHCRDHRYLVPALTAHQQDAPEPSNRSRASRVIRRWRASALIKSLTVFNYIAAVRSF